MSEEHQQDQTSQQVDEVSAYAEEEALATESGEELSEARLVGGEDLTADGKSEESDLDAIEALKRDQRALIAQLEEARAQGESFKSQYVRIAADFENFRRRTSKEKEELETKIKRDTISELLPVIDNFERARSQIKPQNEGETTIHKSYQSVYKQLVDCLKRVGVSPMRPEGKEFDPSLHEAVMREPTDAYPEGTVTEQLVRGYMLNDRVLRHAMVKVAATPEETGEAGNPS